jgi:hypothetical protein
MDQSVINFAVFEDGVEHLGMASVDLPDLTHLTQTISGAGIAGNVETVIKGHVDTMTMTLHFRTTTKNSIKLSAPGRHTIELRAAQQDEDPVSGTLKTVAVKHVFVVIPKVDRGGSVAPAAPTDGSGDYSVRYWKTSIDGQVVREIDPLNFICTINGVDYLEDVRKALGK